MDGGDRIKVRLYGIDSVSKTGDFSDVFVIDANGRKFPWNEASHISDSEMKELMQTVVNRIYDVLLYKDNAEFKEMVLNFYLLYTKGWDDIQNRQASWRD